MIKGISKLPSTDNNISEVLIREMKSVEEENKLLKEEVEYFKKQHDSLTPSQKIMERKLNIVIKYFKDYTESAQEEDPMLKRYKTLLGILSNSTPGNIPNLPMAQPRDYQLARLTNDTTLHLNNSSEGSAKWLENMRNYQQPNDTHTFDSSRNMSTGVNASADIRKRREKILHRIRKMQAKCDGYLQRFEDVEENERMAKIKCIEDRRKSNLNRQVSLVIDKPAGRELNVRDVVVSVTQRGQQSNVDSTKGVNEGIISPGVDSVITEGKPSKTAEKNMSCNPILP